MIGHRLKRAREASGLSLRGLEDAIDELVTAQAIGKYERDEMMPSSTVLLALARALNVSAEHLLRQRHMELTEVDFRKGPAAGAKEERTVEALVLDHAERYLQIEELLPEVGGKWVAPDAREFQINAAEDAESAAARLRQLWRLGLDPIASMTELLEDRGVKIVALKLPDAVSGSKAFALLGGRSVAAMIVVNSSHNGERQRFTLAHELAHLILRFASQLSAKQQEKAADRFAGAFLVTKEALLSLLGRNRRAISIGELLALKRVFKVSIAMLVMRCRQLNILPAAAAGKLWGFLKSRGLLDLAAAEPEPISPEVPGRMERLCLRGVAEGAISEAKAAELLRRPRSEIERLLDAQAA